MASSNEANGTSRTSRFSGLKHRRSQTFTAIPSIAAGSSDLSGSSRRDREPPRRSALGIDTSDSIDRRRSWQLRDEMISGRDRQEEEEYRSTSSASPIRTRSGSGLAKFSSDSSTDRPSTSIAGLRLGGAAGYRHGLPSPPNTNSDAGSGMGSGSAGKRSIGASLGRRAEGVLTPAGSDRARGSTTDGGLKAEELRRGGSDTGSRGSGGSIRRRPATSRVSPGGSIIAPEADSRSQGSGSQTSRNSPRRTSQLLRRTDSSNSQPSPRLPSSPLVRTGSRRSSVDPDGVSPAKIVVPAARVSSSTMSRSSSLRLKRDSTAPGLSSSAKSNATARPERSPSISSSSSSLGAGRVRAKGKGKEVLADDDRPVTVGRSKRLVSMKEKNARILAQVNATLTSPTSSPSREKPNPIVKEPSPSFEITPPTSLQDTRPPPGSRTSTIASLTSSNDEGAIPFAKGRSPAPRKIADDPSRRNSVAGGGGDPWDGSVRRLAPERSLTSGAEAFAGEGLEPADDGPPGSMRRIPAQSEDSSQAIMGQEARKRVEDWTAAAEGSTASGRRTPSAASVRGHRRNLSETLTSSSGTARMHDDGAGDSDAETTPGKGKQRSVSVSSRSSSRLRHTASVDGLGSLGTGSVRGWRTIDAAINRREQERDRTWSTGVRSSERSQTSMSQYPSTVSYSRSNRLSSRAASVLGDYRSSTIGRSSRLPRGEREDDDVGELPGLSSSGGRKVRPGLPDGFLDSRGHRSPALRGSDSRSNGSGSAGRAFPSMTPSRDRLGHRATASEAGGANAYDDFDSTSQASASWRGSVRRQSDMSGRSPRTSMPSPLAEGASARGRHMSLTEIASKVAPRSDDVFAGERDRTRTRSSFSPSHFTKGPSKRPGEPAWWDEVDELRSRLGALEDRPASRAGAPSRNGYRPLSRAESLSTPHQRPERERERTLRGTQTAPTMSPIVSGEEGPPTSYSADARRTASSTASVRDRRSTISDEVPRTPSIAQSGRQTSMTIGRPGSARSGPFSPTPDIETHRLLLQSYDALDRHFAQPGDDQSTDLVRRVASVLRTTCRLNADLRTLADSMRDAQVELQIDDSQATVAIGTLSALDRMTQRALSTSDGQIRDLTEALLALPRVDRERAQLRQEDPASFRPQSRAGRAGSPDKASPATELYSSGNRSLRTALGNHFDDSPSIGHRRGGSIAGSRSSIFPNGRTHSPLIQTEVARASVERSRTIGGGERGRDSPRPQLRPSKSSATSILSTTTAATVKPSPSLSFPRSPSKPSPKLTDTVAEAGTSPTRTQASSSAADALGLVYEPLTADTSPNWRNRAPRLTSGSPQASPKRRSSGGSGGSGDSLTHRRRPSGATAALQRIGSLTRRGFGKARGSLGPMVDDASADISDAYTMRTESSEGAREERRERVNDILQRRSASRSANANA